MRRSSQSSAETRDQFRQSLFLSSAVFLAVLATEAAAQTSQICSAWNVDRGVEVAAPGSQGDACEVIYRKPDENVPDQILWRSSSSIEFCTQKSAELTARLAKAGFDCHEGKLPDGATATTIESGNRQAAAAPDETATGGVEPVSAVSSTTETLPMGGVPYGRVSNQTDASWHLAGYADATFIVSDFAGETTADFSAARFNPVFHFQYKNLILLEAEAEIQVDGEGETEFGLEYAQADIFLHDNATLVVGQFLSPVGQFQERLHPSWINRSPNPPPGFGHDGVQPSGDVGAMLRGGFEIGEMIATYSIAVGNGPRLSHEAGIDFEAKGADDNSNKAISGRLGLLPLPYLEVGGSFLVADVSGEEDHEGVGMTMLEPTDAKVKLWGADAAYTRGPWDVRTEYLKVKRDPMNTAFEGSGGVVALPQLDLEAWYGQIAYSLSGITDHKILQRFEPVVRYGEYRVSGLDELAEEAAEKRWDAGLNYWLAPSIVARGFVEFRDFTARDDDEPSSETRVIFQVSYGF